MTTPSAPEPVPVPIRVLLPGDQEVVAHLWSRRQARDGWRYEVGLPAYRNGPGDTVEPAEYRVWVRAPQHVRPVDGVSYDAVPTEYLERPCRRGTRADDYLCRLCKQSPAAAWDHCHEHGYVRGPLCGSCNTREGTGLPYYFLRLEGAALHLLECRGCLEQRTLPRRFHTAIVRAHLEQTERHGRCPREPYAREVEHAHGVRRFELECSGWHASRWTKDVTVPETAALVQAFVDAALASREGRPSPGPATAAG
ncbi:endonuclease domain-containing protein [Streptomyces sp. NRRL F-5065]|uniref:endonuclease domain-containing protein n=1 Tax=Streptomyces sp. NRRL F-5065 TaxID=1463855 RepID=UPI00068E1FA9|nr:endonuclease domain-containing protein [Streptomyces sp. NRRL F-5065]